MRAFTRHHLIAHNLDGERGEGAATRQHAVVAHALELTDHGIGLRVERVAWLVWPEHSPHVAELGRHLCDAVVLELATGAEVAKRAKVEVAHQQHGIRALAKNARAELELGATQRRRVERFEMHCSDRETSARAGLVHAEHKLAPHASWQDCNGESGSARSSQQHNTVSLDCCPVNVRDGVVLTNPLFGEQVKQELGQHLLERNEVRLGLLAEPKELALACLPPRSRLEPHIVC
eukprot:Amastigsp_a509413_144.p2 type:complete len:234 gc:universal Amastigsp_a509413_144:290-991(+)